MKIANISYHRRILVPGQCRVAMRSYRSSPDSEEAAQQKPSHLRGSLSSHCLREDDKRPMRNNALGIVGTAGAVVKLLL